MSYRTVVVRLCVRDSRQICARCRTLAGLLAASQREDRDAQFRYLNDTAAGLIDDDQPAISVDTRKKELVGDFANGGTEWQPGGEPERVRVHDFMDPALGKVVPCGIYDVANNEGWVNVGDNVDTAVPWKHCGP